MIYSQQVWCSKGGCKLCILFTSNDHWALQDPQIGEVGHGMALSDSSVTSVLEPKP